MSENTIVAPEVVAPKSSRAEKLVARATMLAARIAKDTEDYNNIKLEIDGAERLKNVGQGSLVKVKLGRKFADKDTTRIVVSTVVGVKEDEEGAKQYKVAYGSGFDADIAVVTASQIVEVAVEGKFAEVQTA